MKRDWISSFYLSTRTTTNHTSVETYSYDEQVKLCSVTEALNPKKILDPTKKFKKLKILKVLKVLAVLAIGSNKIFQV